MEKLLYTSRKTLQSKLEWEIEDYEYRYTRYQVDYTISLICTPEPLDMAPLLSKYIRETDHSIILQDRLYAIIFDSANENKGTKAANKLLTYFQQLYFSQSIFASIVTASNFNNPPQMISKLFDLLDYALKHDMDNHLIDPSQIMKSM